MGRPPAAAAQPWRCVFAAEGGTSSLPPYALSGPCSVAGRPLLRAVVSTARSFANPSSSAGGEAAPLGERADLVERLISGGESAPRLGECGKSWRCRRGKVGVRSHPPFRPLHGRVGAVVCTTAPLSEPDWRITPPALWMLSRNQTAQAAAPRPVGLGWGGCADTTRWSTKPDVP